MLDDSGDDGDDLFGMEAGSPSEEELGPDIPSVDGPDVPSVDDSDVPSTSVPSVESPAADDVPGDLRATFWILVVIANGVVLAFSLGLMFVGFRGNWALGVRLFAAAGLLTVLGWRVHWRYERREE